MKSFLSLAMLAMACLPLTANAQTDDRIAHWQADIDHFRRELEARHINLFHTVSQSEFDAAVDRLSGNLASFNDAEIVFELMRITRLVNDGHTQFPVMGGPHRHYPLRYRLFGNEVRVVATSEAHQHLLGARLTAIDGRPIAEILERLAPVVQPAENPTGQQFSLAFHLTVDEMLYGAGSTHEPGSAAFTFEPVSDEPVTQRIHSISMADFSTSVTHRLGPDRRPTDSDLVLSPGLWMTTDRERATAYLNFAQYPSFEDMLEFAAAVRARLEREGIRNLVIDLRENGGGDFYMGLVLSSDILQVDTLDWQYGIYVLIGRHTFSAAMSNAAQFRQILNARLVGEPTGGNPVAYGEAGMFHLPHSGWPVMYSKRFYRFQANDTPGVQPDIPVDTSFAGMRDGRDDVLDWVLRDIAERSARARREQEQTP